MKIVYLFILIIATNLYSSSMKFELVGTGGNCFGCEWISAEGDIIETTPNELKKFLKDIGYSPKIVFNSRGGNLAGGIRIGHILRKNKIAVEIGKTIKDGGHHTIQYNGVCFSSCAYAFLGGFKRNIEEGNRLGFHQFYDKNALKGFANKQFSANDRIMDQFMTGVIVNYLSFMGIDIRLYPIISETLPNKMYIIEKDELSKFNIVTDYKTSEWNLKAYNSGLVAEIKTLEIDQRVARLYKNKNYYYLTILLNNKETHAKNIERIFEYYNLELFIDKNPHLVLDAKLHLSKNKKRSSMVFKIKRDTAIAIAKAKNFYLWGRDNRNIEPSRVFWSTFELATFSNIRGDSRLPLIGLKNPI